MSFASSYKSGSSKNEALHLKKSLLGQGSGSGSEEEEEEDEEEDDDDEEDVGVVGRVVKIKNIDDDDNSEDNSDRDEDNNSDRDEDDNSVDTTSILGGVENILGGNISDEDEDEDDEDDDYLKKFDENLKNNVISEYHPEMLVHNYDEIDVLSRIVRNEEGVIIDPLHKTLPFITKYEKARILGERAKQIDAGAKIFVSVEPDVIDGYLIALKEYEEKKIPFILKRPFSGGLCEYWKFSDLEII
jgi:DNA-directed RNA polymerase subunit K/omega